MIGHRFIAGSLATWTAIAAALTLAACSDSKPQARAPDAPTAPKPPPPEFDLSPLTLADRQANPLNGEVGCAFKVSGPDPLVLAMGSPALPNPAMGLVKVNGKIERLADPSGFDTMVDGVTMNGASKSTVAIQVIGQASGGGKPPAHPATLTYTRADGISRAYAGTWTCAP